MSGFEMDPVFCKALKLLHSNAKDSADQIIHLLEELVDQKYGGTKTLNIKHGNLLFEEHSKLEIPKARVSRGPSPVLGNNQQSEKSSRDSTPPSEPVSSRTSPDLDDGELALEIFEDDLNCTVCKGMSVGARNRLVECSDCHMLYHQECHKPPISENDVNDPRLVWYCCECIKRNQEKVQTKPKPAVSESSSSGHKKSKTDSGDKKSDVFKRSDKSSSSSSHKSSSSSHSVSSNQGSKSKSSSGSGKSSSGLNYNKNPASPNPKTQSGSAPANIIAADKRLQNMKKKAAAKMQEKRVKHK